MANKKLISLRTKASSALFAIFLFLCLTKTTVNMKYRIIMFGNIDHRWYLVEMLDFKVTEHQLFQMKNYL